MSVGVLNQASETHSWQHMSANDLLRSDTVRKAATAFLAITTFATFFIVEHSLTMSLTSEDGDDLEFVEEDLDSNVESGSALRKVGFLAFGGLSVLLLAFPGRTLNWRSPIPWASLAFVFWIAASVFWATDSSLALRRVVVVAMMACGIVAYLRLTSPREAVAWIGRIALAFLTLGFICEVGLLQFRPWTSGFRFGGTTHPNTLGTLGAFASFYAVARAYRKTEPRRLLWLAIAIAALVAVFLTKSRTTLAATMVALTILWAFRATWPQRLLIGLAGTATLSGAIFFALVFNVDAVSQLIDAALLGRSEEATTLTGRVPLWAELNRDVAESPLFGYGFGSFWTPDVLYRVKQNQGWQIPHAHSGYYETLLNLGFVGLLLAVFGSAAALLKAICVDSRDHVAAGMTIATITFAAIYSLTDTAFALPTFASFTLAVVVCQASRLGPLKPKPTECQS